MTNANRIEWERRLRSAAWEGDRQHLIRKGMRVGALSGQVNSRNLIERFHDTIGGVTHRSYRGMTAGTFRNAQAEAAGALFTTRMLGDETDPSLCFVKCPDPPDVGSVGCVGVVKERVLTLEVSLISYMIAALTLRRHNVREMRWQELVPADVMEELGLVACAVATAGSTAQRALTEWICALFALCATAMRHQDVALAQTTLDLLDLLKAGLVPLYWRRNVHNERELVIWRLP